MKFLIPAVLLLVGAAPASAIVTLGLSSQAFGLTGIGANSAGQGQSKMTWGSCAFDGTNTSCTLSGPYTGLPGGGTYSFVISYAGNGPFPLNAISQVPGGDQFFAQATNNFSLVITLTQANGPSVNFYSFANFSFFFTSSATCTGVSSSACGVGQVGLTPNATITGQITGSFDPTPLIRAQSGVISAGGYGALPAVAPSSWVEIYGVNLATTPSRTWAAADFTGNQAPLDLGGTSVTVGGLPAVAYYVSPGQVNVQVPSGVATGSQPVLVTTAGGTSAPYSVTVKATAPGLLALPVFPFFNNGNQNVVALFSNTLTFVLPGAVAGISSARAKAGDKITLYGIGFGPVTPSIPSGQIVQQQNDLQLKFAITFGGVPATVTYSGLGPGNVGLYQFNVVVPSVPAGDTVPVAFTVNGVPGTQTLVMSIQ